MKKRARLLAILLAVSLGVSMTPAGAVVHATETSEAGKYTFTAKLPKGYKLAEDVVLPKIKIEIIEEETEAKETEAKETEAKKADTKETEAKKADTKETEAKKADTKETEAKKADAKETEAKKADTKETEAKKADTKETEPKKADTKETEPKKADTKETEKETEAQKADAKESEKPGSAVTYEKHTEDESESNTDVKQEEPAQDEKQGDTENPPKESESETTTPQNPAAAEMKLLTFEVKDAKVTIDEEKQTVTILMQKTDADLKKIAPKLTIPEGMTVSPASEAEVDFSESVKTPVVYKLTRTSDQAEKEYKVSAEICKHDWKTATCTEAAVCKNCDVKGEAALGHSFAEATCTKAKTCTRCQTTEGNPLGHAWSKATCAKKSTCERCQEVQGKFAGHKWREWKTVEKATHTKKGKKERICKVCGDEQSKTIPRTNLKGEAKDNKITGLNTNYTTGINITFKAEGAGMDNSKPLEGDVRYKPVSWVCGTGSGALEGDSYNKTIQFTNAGDYTLKVTYERQVYRDGEWRQKGDSDTKSVSLKITGNTVNSPNGGKVAAVTGDQTPILLFAVIFVLSFAILAGMFYMNLKRKRAKK